MLAARTRAPPVAPSITIYMISCPLFQLVQFWDLEVRGEVTKAAANKMSQGCKQWVHRVAQQTLASHARNLVCLWVWMRACVRVCVCVCVCARALDVFMRASLQY